MNLILCPTADCGTELDLLADICPGCALIAPGGAYTRYFPADRLYLCCLSCGVEIVPADGRLFDRSGYLNDGGICANCLRVNPTTERADDQPTPTDRWRWRVRQSSPVWSSIGLYILLYAMPAILIWIGGDHLTPFASAIDIFFQQGWLSAATWLCLIGMPCCAWQSFTSLPNITDKVCKRPLLGYLWWLLVTEGISSVWNTAIGCFWLSVVGSLVLSLIMQRHEPAIFHAAVNLTLYLFACCFVQIMISGHLLLLMLAGKYWPHGELWLRKQRGDFAAGLCRRLARQ